VGNTNKYVKSKQNRKAFAPSKSFPQSSLAYHFSIGGFFQNSLHPNETPELRILRLMAASPASVLAGCSTCNCPHQVMPRDGSCSAGSLVRLWCVDLVASSISLSSSSCLMIASSLSVLLSLEGAPPGPSPRVRSVVPLTCVLQRDAGSIDWMNRFRSFRATRSRLGGIGGGCGCSEPKDAHVPILNTCAMNCQQSGMFPT
jgi:hypothetical protein